MKQPKRIMPKEIATIKLRHNLGEILDQVTNKHERFRIKRSGIPATIILSVSHCADSADLIDTWHERQDTAFQQSLVNARHEITAG